MWPYTSTHTLWTKKILLFMWVYVQLICTAQTVNVINTVPWEQNWWRSSRGRYLTALCPHLAFVGFIIPLCNINQYVFVIERVSFRINNQQDASSNQNFYFITKHVEFRDKITSLDTWCILLVIYKKIITTHGYLNVKRV